MHWNPWIPEGNWYRAKFSNFVWSRTLLTRNWSHCQKCHPMKISISYQQLQRPFIEHSRGSFSFNKMTVINNKNAAVRFFELTCFISPKRYICSFYTKLIDFLNYFQNPKFLEKGTDRRAFKMVYIKLWLTLTCYEFWSTFWKCIILWRDWHFFWSNRTRNTIAMVFN